MKHRLLSVAAGLAALIIGHVAVAADETPVLTDISISNAYIPLGFDANDHSQLVIAGSLPNSCFRIAPASAVVNKRNKTIVIHQKAYVYRSYCLQMLIPYIETVSVGILVPGKYQVFDGMTHKSLGGIDVESTTGTSQDAYLYLPLNDAYVQQDSDDDAAELVMTGTYPDSCFTFKEALIDYYSNLIQVRPVAEHVDSGTGCAPTPTPFTVKVPLRSDLSGTFLLHVRSLNGLSINKLTSLH